VPREESAAVIIAHRCGGRARLRFADGSKDVLTLAGLAAGLRDLDGVVAVSARTGTGSVIVTHEGDFGAIAEEAARRQICIFTEIPAAEPQGFPIPLPPPAMIGAAGLVSLAGFQFLRGHTLPPAMTLLWYAASLLGHTQLSPFVEAPDGGAD
jgi:hypothetical protein